MIFSSFYVFTTKVLLMQERISFLPLDLTLTALFWSQLFMRFSLWLYKVDSCAAPQLLGRFVCDLHDDAHDELGHSRSLGAICNG